MNRLAMFSAVLALAAARQVICVRALLLGSALLLGGPRLVAQACDSFWLTVPTPAQGPGVHRILGLSGLEPGDAWAVGGYDDESGSQPLALHRTGETWEATVLPVMPPGFVMSSVDVAGAHDVWAVGGQGPAQAFHHDGVAWTLQELPPPGASTAGTGVSDVLALARDDVWAVGHDDLDLAGQLRTAVWHWDGAAWSVIPSPNVPDTSGGFRASALVSIAAAGPGALFAVGEWRLDDTWLPLAMRWDGATWTLLTLPASQADGDGRLRSVSARSAQDVWAVGLSRDTSAVVGGGYGRAFALHFDGTQWTEIPVEQPSQWDVNPLSAVLADEHGVLAVGTWENRSQGLDSLIVRYDGTGFVAIPSAGIPGDMQGSNELHDMARIGDETWTAGDGSGTFFDKKVPLVERLVDPCAASVAVAGTGTPGCAGPLEIGADSVPTVGNASLVLNLAGLPPSSAALALLGTAADAGGTLAAGYGVLVHIDLAATSFLLPIGLTSGPDGKAVLPLPIPDNPQLAGMSVVLQGFAQWASPCPPSSSGWCSTPALILTIAP